MYTHTSKKEKIAVLLAAYNGEKWIKEQLLSIVNQKNIDVSVFVSIDCSNDKTKSIVEKLGLQYKNITIINSKIKFGSAAANFLHSLQNIDLSDFSYLSFSDQDDIWMLDKLSVAIDHINTSKSDAYSSNLIAFDNMKHRCFIINKIKNNKKLDYMFQGSSAGCTYVLTRKATLLVQKKITNLPIVYFKSKSHDWLIYAICRSHGLHWYHDVDSYIFYRQHSDNAFGALPGISGGVFRFSFAKTGWYREHIIQMKNVLVCSELEIKTLNALERFNWIDRLWLIANAYHFRRSLRDAFFLSVLIFLKLI